MSGSAKKRLSNEELLRILQPNGLLHQSLREFESRPQQQQMMQNIIEAYNRNKIALIEAGTGTGKTIAYLLPALFWSAQCKERSLISTNTIALQEQLINKDIPLLAKALDMEIKAVLVKGMSNYLCLRKFEEVEQNPLSLSIAERKEMDSIASWRRHTTEGSRSTLSFLPTANTWEKINAESDTCSNMNCPHYHKCFFFKARREAQDAHILVVNHHMLFADLVCRAETDNYKDPSILPAYNRMIIDEAHHIEEIATEYFASKVDRLQVIRLLAKLSSENQDRDSERFHGKLPLLLHKIHSYYKNNFDSNVGSIIQRLTIDLPNLRRDLYKEQGELFEHFVLFSKQMKSNDHETDRGTNSETKLRLLPEHLQHQEWHEKLQPQLQRVTKIVHHYIQSIRSLCQDIENIKNEKLLEDLQSVLHDIHAFTDRLEEAFLNLHHFVSSEGLEERVRWIESQQFNTLTNIHLVDAELDVAASLAKALFEKFDTIILCSATLTTNRSFDFIRRRLGLTAEYISHRAISENIYDSPFDYQKQSVLAIPTDIPAPTDPKFIDAAAEQILQTLQTCQGNAFVLFTSYTMLRQCHTILAEKLRENRFSLFKQGDDNRLSLLNQFKAADRAVLFGTDSFWEGIDIAGENLRCVIIVKLPFKVPTEPIIQARTEAIVSKGGDAFTDYAIPTAIVKFKQGCGRLIRGHRDRGCIVCLDKRLISKDYGKLFLNSLPNCQQIFAPSVQMQLEMKDFYRKTYHFVNK